MDDLSGKFSDKLVSHITSALDSDMICFVNPDTYEMEDVPHDVLSGLYQDEMWQEALNRVDRWKRFITIDRPGTTDTVKMMQTFIEECVPPGRLKEQLYDATMLRRPDKHFHEIVENSDFRKQWTAYHRRQMVRHVRRKLRDNMANEASLPSVALS